MTDLNNITEKTILITGGCSGLGLYQAKYFEKKGCKVCVLDISDKNEEFKDTNINYIKTDVSNEESITSAFSQISEKYTHIDAIINNVGIVGIDDIENLDFKYWQKAYSINVLSIGLIAKNFVRLMTKGGSIINTSSQSAVTQMHGYEPYSHNKLAILGLTRTMALEFAEKNIRVNSVSPTTFLSPSQPEDNEEAKFAKISIPLGRIATTKDLIGTYHFLISEASLFITGQNIVIDGGWSCGINKKIVDKILS